MRNYTIQLMSDYGIVTLRVTAQNKAAAITQVTESKGCPLSAIVFRREGRKGKWNEYVEFDPNRLNRVKFVAQKSGAAGWYVFETYPGAKGAVRTLAHYDFKLLAVDDAQRRAHA